MFDSLGREQQVFEGGVGGIDSVDDGDEGLAARELAVGGDVVRRVVGRRVDCRRAPALRGAADDAAAEDDGRRDGGGGGGGGAAAPPTSGRAAACGDARGGHRGGGDEMGRCVRVAYQQMDGGEWEGAQLSHFRQAAVAKELLELSGRRRQREANRNLRE